MTRSILVASLTLVGALGFADRAPAQGPTVTPTRSPAVSTALTPDGPVSAYERKGRRDPFEPVENLQPDQAAPTVAAARLRGIVRGERPRALVETSDGLGYILKVGDTLAEGRVVEIGRDNVVFNVPSRRGPDMHRIVLRLPED